MLILITVEDAENAYIFLEMYLFNEAVVVSNFQFQLSSTSSEVPVLRGHTEVMKAEQFS